MVYGDVVDIQAGPLIQDCLSQSPQDCDVAVAVHSPPRFKKAEVSTASGVEALEGLQDLGLSLVLSSPLRNLKAHLLAEEIAMVSS